jgi:hypothetical protein
VSAGPGESAFRKIAIGMLGIRGVTEGTGFGANPGLRYKSKIFAMLGRGNLIVKLPKSRVDELADAGIGARFHPRRDGRAMKEWATVSVGRRGQWEELVEEALRFARSPSAKSR